MADDRAERAFWRAFAEHADEHDFAPLDPDALAALARRSDGSEREADGRRRPPWLALVAAAAVIVVGLPLAGSWLAQRGGGPVTSAAAPAAAPAPSVRDQSAAGSGPQPASAPEAAGQGCPASLADAASPGSVEGLSAASEVVVCQYAAGGRELVGTASLTGPDAQRVLEAVLGGRLSSDAPLTCSPGTEEVLLRFDGGVREVRLAGADATAAVCG